MRSYVEAEPFPRHAPLCSHLPQSGRHPAWCPHSTLGCRASGRGCLLEGAGVGSPATQTCQPLWYQSPSGTRDQASLLPTVWHEGKVSWLSCNVLYIYELKVYAWCQPCSARTIGLVSFGLQGAAAWCRQGWYCCCVFLVLLLKLPSMGGDNAAKVIPPLLEKQGPYRVCEDSDGRSIHLALQALHRSIHLVEVPVNRGPRLQGAAPPVAVSQRSGVARPKCGQVGHGREAQCWPCKSTWCPSAEH